MKIHFNAQLNNLSQEVGDAMKEHLRLALGVIGGAGELDFLSKDERPCNALLTIQCVPPHYEAVILYKHHLKGLLLHLRDKCGYNGTIGGQLIITDGIAV